MKQAQDVLDSIYKFTQTQKNSIDVLAAELVALKDKHIGLDTLNTLTNCFRELDGLRENIISRLIASMKRGDMVS
jgi:hypothetical protein